jgi:glutamate racemase
MRHGPIGVIGTAGTIASNAYARAIQSAKPGTAVEQKACPLFVPLVEEGWFDHPAAELIAAEYLEPMKRARVDVMVLGCTHYPLLKPLLQRTLGPDIRLIDSGEETALTVQSALRSSGLDAPPSATPEHRFVVSDDEARFRHVGSRFIGERLGSAEVVPLG